MSITQIIDAIYSFCQNAMQIMGYPGLAIVMFIENVFPPIPSEIVLPLAGTLTVAANGEPAQFNIIAVILWATIGTFAGAWLWYWVGHLIGENWVRRTLHKIGKYIMITEKDLDYALTWFERYGEWVVFFGRMIPIVRTLISVPAGFAKMNWVKFSVFTLAGTLIWNTILAFAGRLLGANYTLVVGWIERFKEVIIILAIVALIAFFGYRIYKTKIKKQSIE